MDGCSMSMAVMCLALMMGITVIGLAEAQDVPPCASQLIPCMNYRNSTTPPNSCCDPIKHLHATQRTCLCKLIFTPDIIEGFGITSTRAIKLSHSCGVDVNISICKAALSAQSPSSTVQPPAIPGSDEGGAGRAAFSGALSFVLLFWTSVLFT